jgi:ankyrin repeat protein
MLILMRIILLCAGHTALHCAILEHGKPSSEGVGGVANNLPIIQALIQHGADPNAQGRKNGKTPLMYALESRDVTLIETLVSLIDPARLMAFLRTRAYDETTCLNIQQNLQRTMDEPTKLRLQNCLKVKARKEC